MKTSRVFFALLLSGLGASAKADVTLATGGVYGGPDQKKAYCYVQNAGSTQFSLIDGSILQENGADVTSARLCGVPKAPWGFLIPGATCELTADIQAGHTYGCVFNIPGRAARRDVRGTMDIRDGADHVLISSPLR